MMKNNLSDEYKKALNYAVRAVGYRRLTEKQLYQKLMEKEFSREAAAYAMGKLREYGGLDDTEYAQALTRSLTGKGYGRSRIAAKLKDKGIEADIADEALTAYEPNMAVMKKYIQSKIKTEEPDRATLKKVSDGLFRRGFSWNEIRKALQYWNDEDDYDL